MVNFIKLTITAKTKLSILEQTFRSYEAIVKPLKMNRLSVDGSIVLNNSDKICQIWSAFFRFKPFIERYTQETSRR
ncbi:hypothetical protein VHARVF571_180241 [Vibrio harveyi]|uniref:hypothetical protein n=2 Tax=Vibrio harveyi TaxID=669 RepID=UPI00068128FF|nr:hypothetical protein [Vibrio harveyi]CAH1527151.1 hypothetical protein VHARVF571_180241 [Vibrio harveyi]